MSSSADPDAVNYEAIKGDEADPSQEAAGAEVLGRGCETEVGEVNH